LSTSVHPILRELFLLFRVKNSLLFILNTFESGLTLSLNYFTILQIIISFFYRRNEFMAHATLEAAPIPRATFQENLQETLFQAALGAVCGATSATLFGSGFPFDWGHLWGHSRMLMDRFSPN
jgi:hypothetical protein